MEHQNIFPRAFWKIIALLILIEILSFLSFWSGLLSTLSFSIIVLGTFIVAMYRVEYGLFVVLVELFLGSKGYLFSLQIGDFVLSIRMALFLVLISVWIFRILQRRSAPFFKTSIARWYIGFLLILVLGIVRGWMFGNAQHSIFFDVNGYLYLLLFPVFYETLHERQKAISALPILAASSIVTALKTFFTIFLFATSSNWFVLGYYRWIRNSGVGEITPVSGDLFRVFFQSHVYSLIGFFIFAVIYFSWKKTLHRADRFWLLLSIFGASFSVVFSLSRSFWAGLVFGGIAVFAGLKRCSMLSWKQMSALLLTLAFFFALQIGFMYFLTRAPVADLLGKRITDVGEAAASSRMQQLSPLTSAIKRHPWLGSGFGTEVTYITNDPRTRAQDKEGRLTTYAFEWGYFDIWLKIGALGLAFYLLIIGRILLHAQRVWKQDQKSLFSHLMGGMACALVALIATHIFSPYLNHPLGIGYIMLMTGIMSSK